MRSEKISHKNHYCARNFLLLSKILRVFLFFNQIIVGQTAHMVTAQGTHRISHIFRTLSI